MSAADRAAFMRMMGITDDDLLDPNENTNTSTTTTTPENTQHKSISLHATLSSASSSAGVSSAAGTHTTSTVHLSPSSSATLTRTTSLSLPQASLPQPSLSCIHQSIPTINMTNTLSETHFSHNEEEPTPASTQTLLLSSPELTQRAGLHHTPYTTTTTTTTTTNTAHYANMNISSRAGHSAEELKAAGNVAFTRGAFVEAITHYSHAIEALRDMQRNTLHDSGGVFVELLAALYGNRSASYLQAARALDSIEVAYEHALMDAETAVQLRPSWFKGYARQGDVYFKMLHYSKAADAYAMALRLEPSNANVERAYYESRTRASAASREEIARRRARRSRQRMSSTSRPRLTAASMPNSTNESSMHGVPPVTRTLVLQAPTANNDNTSSSSMECMSVPGKEETASQTHSAQQVLAETALTTTTTTNALASETGCISKDESDNNTPAKAMWRELKAELATLSQEPTGDDYRRQQLERFRRQQQQSRFLSQNTTTTTMKEGNVSCNAGQTSVDASPHTADTSAATEINKTNDDATFNCNDKEAAETPRECWAIGSDVRRSMTTKPHSAEPCRSSNMNNEPVVGSTTGSISSTGGLTHTSANSTNDVSRTIHNKEAPMTSSTGGSSSVPSSRASSSGPGQRMRFMSIPEQFSSSAATAYQQRLLEEFRKKKAMHK